jgi:hypothetical protein
MSVQVETCVKSDAQIIKNALFARCRTLERILERDLDSLERKKLQDEYERTFALTANFQRERPP